MEILLNIVFIVIGVAIVLWGADRLTSGAVSVASQLGVSQMVIGLTVVALGTSMPEFCVSFVSALRGTADMAVGNVVGSNVFNAMLIVGAAAVTAPMSVMRQTVRKDLVFALAASVAMTAFILDGVISRVDAALLLVMFVLYMWGTLRGAHEGVADNQSDASGQESSSKPERMWLSCVWIVVGLVCLIFGSNLFVENASRMALALSVPEAVVGLTIVAGGTSMPELATSVVAARRGNSGIAMGNVIGSNVFNVLFVAGATGVVSPMSVSGITAVDLGVFVASMALLWLFAFTKLTVARWEGGVMIVLFLAYMTWLIV